MKLEKDAVTICGFVAIFMLIILIIAPPVLRGLLGSEGMGNSNTLLSNVIERMECERLDNYTNYSLNRKVTTVYKNNEVSNIEFLYNVMFLTNDVNNDLANVYINEYSMLKQVTNASVVEGNNELKVVFDYEKYDFKYDQFLSKYSNDVTNQMQYYSNNGYTCKIIK